MNAGRLSGYPDCGRGVRSPQSGRKCLVQPIKPWYNKKVSKRPGLADSQGSTAGVYSGKYGKETFSLRSEEIVPWPYDKNTTDFKAQNMFYLLPLLENYWENGFLDGVFDKGIL